MKKIDIDFDLDKVKAQIEEDNKMVEFLLQKLCQTFPESKIKDQIDLLKKAESMVDAFITDQQQKNQADGAIWEYKDDIIKLMIEFKQSV